MARASKDTPRPKASFCQVRGRLKQMVFAAQTARRLVSRRQLMTRSTVLDLYKSGGNAFSVSSTESSG